MTETYADFMIFELKNTGERRRLDLTEQEFRENNGDGILHQTQVAIIVKEDLRRIYIWKGYASSVRKKFIASRVASELQQELTKKAGFHRCKVISVDQGEEPLDFLNAFSFQSQEIPQDFEAEIPVINYGKLNLNDNKNIELKEQTKSQVISQELKKNNSKSFVPKSFEEVKREQHSRDILQEVLEYSVPDNYQRKHILTGNNILYGEITKKANVFGETIEEKEWAEIDNLSEEVFELKGHKLRIHFNNKLKMVQAIEILEMTAQLEEEKKRELKIDYSKWTVKDLRAFCKKNQVKIPSGSRKADIVKIVEDFTSL